MLKIFQINTVPYGSTAKVMMGIGDSAIANGMQVVYACGYSYHPINELKGKYIKINGLFGKSIHMQLTRLTGLHGVFSYFSTKKLLRKIKKINPDIIHLHNIHGWFLHFPSFFKYIKQSKARVVWTLHDCWSFTGQCPHFDMIQCDKWKSGCYACTQHKDYPKTYIDKSKRMYHLKKQWFTNINDLTIVTPSQWLADLVKQSFLKEYPVKVINNGIDLSVFKPTESDFRKKYGLENKYILLGVAFGWGKRKGLDVFIELSKRLDENYQIVLVGTDDNIDKHLPQNIISIHRTQNQTELAEIYSAADLFVNPTREENFPTVNIEALACGTPVLTFRTGGSPEIIDEMCGAVVDKDDIDSMQKEIERICLEKPYASRVCMRRGQDFDKNNRLTEYLYLYDNFEVIK